MPKREHPLSSKVKEELNLNFFKEHGYQRKRCKTCGDYFWTINPDRETCGEAPCDPYTFIGGVKGIPKLTLDEIREGFLRYLEKKGHTRVPRRPVIARWREDLFLTDASIIAFQPYVTAGIVPPPANPLCISQVCIRLKDIDKVGLTFGRHLTIFEMMAHHAFNYPEKSVYWKEETVSIHHEFATKVLNIPEEEIVYKEGIWEGGGNAGPDLECIAYGLEIATLVFMMYGVTDEGKYYKIPIKIVDTGYGLERFAWLASGMPSAFHPIYRELVDRFAALTSITIPPTHILEEYSKISSLMGKIEEGRPLRELREKAARKLGIPATRLDTMLSPLEAVYTLLDHTKCILFMLADGLIPSNAKEGYLGRLVIRRALSKLWSLPEPPPLSELVALQIGLWSKPFPELKEEENRVLEIVEIEEKKFKDLLERGSSIVRRLVSSKAHITVDHLVELYDSHGIPPALASKMAKELGVEVAIPDNFYELVAARHYKPKAPPIPEETRYASIVQELRKFPPTRRVYYENPYLSELETEVVAVTPVGVLLKETIFYPEGGGQPSDRGVLVVNGLKLPVKSVKLIGEWVLHEVESTTALSKKARVKCILDWERRVSLMRQHTATHVLLGAAKAILGSHIWQAGSELDIEESRLDISHYKPLTESDLESIEILANRIVTENRRVTAKFENRTKAEERYGFEIYQGGVVPGAELRIVEIEGFNAQACGGTHVAYTGEIGLIKVLRTEKIQENVVRLIYSAGLPAVRKIAKVYSGAAEAARLVNKRIEEVPSAIRELLLSVRALRSENRKLRVGLCIMSLESAPSHTVKGVKAVIAEVEESDTRILIDSADSYLKTHREDPAIIVLCSKTAVGGLFPIIVMVADQLKKTFPANVIAEKLSEATGGSGGGSEKLAHLAAPSPPPRQQVIAAIVRAAK